jgi:predicted adenylyl cyclase CyaB
MPANIEIKARVHSPNEVSARVRALAGDPAGTFCQEDVFFRVPRGRLKMRVQSDNSVEFIYYQRSEHSVPMYSAYFRASPANSNETENELRRLFGTKGTVRKTRTLFWLNGARIHVDDVEGLGHFLEIEVPVSNPSRAHHARALADEIISCLRIPSEDFVCQAYEELLANA